MRLSYTCVVASEKRQRGGVIHAGRDERNGLPSVRAITSARPPGAIEAPPGSFLDGIEDLIGSVEGPTDLSTNPKYLEGLGR